MMSHITYNYSSKQTHLGAKVMQDLTMVWHDEKYFNILLLSLYRAVLAPGLLRTEYRRETRHWKHKAAYFWQFPVCEFQSSGMCSSLSQRTVSFLIQSNLGTFLIQSNIGTFLNQSNFVSLSHSVNFCESFTFSQITSVSWNWTWHDIQIYSNVFQESIHEQIFWILF